MTIGHFQSTIAAAAAAPEFVIEFTGFFSESELGAAPQTASVEVQADGDIGTRPNGGGFSDSGNWITPKSKATEVNADYEVYLTKSSGTDPTSGLSLNTAYVLSTGRTWNWAQGSTGTLTFSGVMHIIPVGGLTNGDDDIDTSSVSITITAF